VPCTRNPL